MPLLGDPGHQQLVSQLRGLGQQLRKPSAIVVISAHWEEAIASVTATAAPELIYDYYGFPAPAYQLVYPCPGAPALAAALQRRLEAAAIPVHLDQARGFDHGLFVPLMLMYPQADIPCLQLSLLKNLDADAHLRLGEALQDLEWGNNLENVLVLGSGFSFHNMREFFHTSPGGDEKNRAFQQWLGQTLAATNLDEEERRQRLLNWSQAPHARYCHPREEHLLPLQVCYGMAARPCDEVMTVDILDKQASLFLWR